MDILGTDSRLYTVQLWRWGKVGGGRAVHSHYLFAGGMSGAVSEGAAAAAVEGAVCTVRCESRGVPMLTVNESPLDFWSIRGGTCAVAVAGAAAAPAEPVVVVDA